MGLSKSRGSKRSSSSSSYVTITTVTFIALCVLGVWMLTNNFVIPPQNASGQTSNTGTSTMSSIATTSALSSKNEISKPDDHTSTNTNPNTNTFDDNPGHLPDDAIKSDEPNKPHNVNEGGDKFSEEKSLGIESLLQESHDNQKPIDDHEQEKQKEGLTQISEESSFTQSQQAEQALQTQKDINELQSNMMVGNENLPANKIQENMKNNNAVSSDIPNEEKANKEQLLEDEGIKNPLESENQISENQKVENQDTNKMVQKGETQEEQPQQHDEQDKDIQNQNNTLEPTNEVSEDDQKKRVEEHKQQKHKKQHQNSDPNSQNDEANQDQPSKHEFTDVTNQSQENQQQKTIKTQQKGRNAKKKATATNLGKSLPTAINTGIPKESKESKKSWSTQAAESENEKDRRKDETDNQGNIVGYEWQLCNVTTGPDYIPCLDNEKALKHLHSTKHFQHRERHCPKETPTCLVPTPPDYKRPISWPQSREKIWYHNVPHTLLAQVKGHQNWVKVTGEFLTFPGGGTQFIHGALHYIDFIQQSVPGIAWGKHTRVVLDVGCGVASFGGFLFDKDVVTMSFAPKDEHEAQVQFALERGIPAISAVMGSQRLPFPSRVFDIVHCARCRVPWHEEGGRLLLELNRVLRPGGYFVWSATPVYQNLTKDVEIWKEMSSLTASMCWELVTIQKDKLNSIGAAIYRKPTSNQCYDQRMQNQPPMCNNDDDPNAAWYVPLKACMHRVPVEKNERGTKWPMDWPQRLQMPPYWLNSSQMGIYGKPSPEDFATDYDHWRSVVNNTYIIGLRITWSNVRNVMDMRAVYGGFAAALRDLPIWVLNVVNVDSPDTLPIIYERGLFGMYHDWCESFSTYPRTYDLLHADRLFSKLKRRCKLPPVMAEIDRIVRPGGNLIVRDESHVIGEVDNLLKSMHWEVHLSFTKNQEGILSAQKGDWRPNTFVESS